MHRHSVCLPACLHELPPAYPLLRVYPLPSLPPFFTRTAPDVRNRVSLPFRDSTSDPVPLAGLRASPSGRYLLVLFRHAGDGREAVLLPSGARCTCAGACAAVLPPASQLLHAAHTAAGCLFTPPCCLMPPCTGVPPQRFGLWAPAASHRGCARCGCARLCLRTVLSRLQHCHPISAVHQSHQPLGWPPAAGAASHPLPHPPCSHLEQTSPHAAFVPQSLRCVCPPVLLFRWTSSSLHWSGWMQRGRPAAPAPAVPPGPGRLPHARPSALPRGEDACRGAHSKLHVQ